MVRGHVYMGLFCGVIWGGVFRPGLSERESQNRIHFSFARTKFKRIVSLRFGKILRTFWKMYFRWNTTASNLIFIKIIHFFWWHSIETLAKKIEYTLFFVRTMFIRTPSLRFGKMLKTFWRLKSPSFLIVLKVKYWGSKPPFLPNNVFFCWLSIANFGQKW